MYFFRLYYFRVEPELRGGVQLCEFHSNRRKSDTNRKLSFWGAQPYHLCKYPTTVSPGRAVPVEITSRLSLTRQVLFASLLTNIAVSFPSQHLGLIKSAVGVFNSTNIALTNSKLILFESPGFNDSNDNTSINIHWLSYSLNPLMFSPPHTLTKHILSTTTLSTGAPKIH